MTDTRKIIDYAMDEDAVGVREAMYSQLHDRVMAAIDAKKQEVGAALMGMPFATEQVEQDEDTLDEKWAKEEKEEGHEDEAEDKKMCKDVATKVAKKEVKGHEKRMHNEEEELDEDLPGAVNKVTKFVGKAMDTVGAVGKLAGTVAGKTLGGVSQTAGAIRQTAPAVGQAYNMGRAGAQKTIAK
jgi:hypothetical protein